MPEFGGRVDMSMVVHEAQRKGKTTSNYSGETEKLVELRVFSTHSELPYQHFVMDTHRNPVSFCVTNRRQFGGNWHLIP